MDMLYNALLSKGIFFRRSRPDLRYDFTKIVNDGELFHLVIKRLDDLISTTGIKTIAGHGYGGTQLVAGLVAKNPSLKSIIVRHEPHANQEGRQVEGIPSTECILVDDAIFSGSSAKEAASILKAIGIEVKALVVLFDDQRPLGTLQIEQTLFPVLAAYRRHDFGLTRDAVSNESLFDFSTSSLVWADYDGNQSKWPFKSSPCFYNGLLINSIDRYKTRGYDALSGEIVWEHSAFQDLNTKGTAQELRVENGYLYTTWYNGGVYKLNPMNGEVLWAVKLDAAIHSTPTFTEETLLINTETWEGSFVGGSLISISAETGRVNWRKSWNHYAPSSVSISRNKVFGSANDGEVACVDLQSGRVLWSKVLNSPVKGKPLVRDGMVYFVTMKGDLLCFSETGEEVFVVKQAVAAGWFVEPESYSGMITLVDSAIDGSSHVVGYDPLTGERVWINKLRSPGVGQTFLGSGELLVAGTDGKCALFSQTTKIWEINKKVPGTSLASKPCVDQQLGLIAFNFQEGGLQVYKLHDRYVHSHSQRCV